MPITPDGRWVPLITPRQGELMEIARSQKYRFVLASGPRLTGKSFGVLHCLMDHAWRTDPANVVIVTVTQSAGYDSGIWTDLVEIVVPHWIEGNFGMEWIRRPAVSHVSKKPYFVISNHAGNPVRFQLESLKNETEVEARFKGKRYSCLCVNELSNFRNRTTLDTWSECLRMVGLPPEQHLFIADTNPSDEGTSSWIYRLWFELKNADLNSPEYQKSFTAGEIALLKLLQPMLAVVEFSLDDNIMIEPARVEQLKAMLAANRDLYARYVEGRWVTASTDAIFSAVFRENVHVVGEITTPANPNPLILAPEEQCRELLTGWDLGVTNSAAVIVEKISDPARPGLPIFKVLDELVILGEDFAMDEFVWRFVERMKYWESRAANPLRWVHYSDRSAFDMRDPVSNRYHHQIVWESSPPDTPGGPIQLIAAARGRDSVRQRVELLRKLLWEERIFFSAELTPRCIEMLKSLKRSKSQQYSVDRFSPHKHVFDALMYCVSSECYDEIMANTVNSLRRIREDGLVNVPI